MDSRTFLPNWNFSYFKSFVKDLVPGFDGPLLEYSPKFRVAQIRILDM
jgi:hypothetical protein